MAMEIEIKTNKNKSIEFEDFITISSLSYANRELTALLYDCSEKRNEVIFALRHPNKFLKDLGNILNIVYSMIDSIRQLADLCLVKLPNIPATEILNMDEANLYVFHNFSSEQINNVNQCYAISNGTYIDIFNLDFYIRSSINVLVSIQQDLLVTIIRFEEYIRRFPDANLRREYINQNFINPNDYD